MIFLLHSPLLFDSFSPAHQMSLIHVFSARGSGHVSTGTEYSPFATRGRCMLISCETFGGRQFGGLFLIRCETKRIRAITTINVTRSPRMISNICTPDETCSEFAQMSSSADMSARGCPFRDEGAAHLLKYKQEQ